MHETAKKVRDAINSPIFLQIKERLIAPNLYSILGRSNQEDWYSHFISWLLNPKSMHGLGSYPLKQFLSLALIKGEDDVRKVAVRTMPSVQSIDTFKVIDSCFMPDSMIGAQDKEFVLRGRSEEKRRLDIVATIECAEPGCQINSRLLLVCENKINSSEIVYKNGVAQTVEYAAWADKEVQSPGPGGQVDSCVPHFPLVDTKNVFSRTDMTMSRYRVLVYLYLGGEKKGAKSDRFVNVTYRDFAKFVLYPSFEYPHITALGRSLLDTFIKELDRNAYATSNYILDMIRRWLNQDIQGIKYWLMAVLYKKVNDKSGVNKEYISLNWLLYYADRSKWDGLVKTKLCELKLETKTDYTKKRIDWTACPKRTENGKNSSRDLFGEDWTLKLKWNGTWLPLEECWKEFCAYSGLDDSLQTYANDMFNENIEVLSICFKHALTDQEIRSILIDKGIYESVTSLFKGID